MDRKSFQDSARRLGKNSDYETSGPIKGAPTNNVETQTVESSKGTQYERAKTDWTPEMREAQAARMRKLHKSRKFQLALRRGQKAGRLTQIANRTAPPHITIPARTGRGGARYKHPEQIHRRAEKFFAKGWTAQEVARKLGLKLSLMYAWKSKFQRKGENRENGNDTSTTAIVPASAENRTEATQVQHHGGGVSQYEKEHVISALGECRGFLKEYAIRYNLPFQDFARRVGQILYRAEIR